MTCGATVFVLFWLYLAGQVDSLLKLFGNFIYLLPCDVYKQTLELLLFLHLALFDYLSIIIADQTCYSIGS